MSTKITRLVLVQTFVIMAMFAAATIYGPASAASSLQLPNSVIKGLSAKWWQWAFSFPTDKSPLSDTTGERCDKGDVGKIFFLAGTAGPISSTQTRDCTISHSDAILVPIANAACIVSHVCATDKPVTDIKELKKQVASQANLVVLAESKATITIDGQNVNLNLQRVQSPLFKTSVVPNNPFNEPPIEKGTAFADGYWVLLKPLPIGEHTLHFKGVFDLGQDDFVVELTYHITVT